MRGFQNEHYYVFNITGFQDMCILNSSNRWGVFLMKFQNDETKSLISVFSVFSCSEKQFKASCNKKVKMKNSKELKTMGPSFLKLP